MFIFEDEKAEEFKANLIKYMRDFWINGCLPPRVWNTFGRSEDLTNNNQEGYNSKFNFLCKPLLGEKDGEGKKKKKKNNAKFSGHYVCPGLTTLANYS